eukprot:6003719-Pleurochrysis_carterae.AAC.1
MCPATDLRRGMSSRSETLEALLCFDMRALTRSSCGSSPAARGVQISSSRLTSDDRRRAARCARAGGDWWQMGGGRQGRGRKRGRKREGEREKVGQQGRRAVRVREERKGKRVAERGFKRRADPCASTCASVAMSRNRFRSAASRAMFVVMRLNVTGCVDGRLV